MEAGAAAADAFGAESRRGHALLASEAAKAAYVAKRDMGEGLQKMFGPGGAARVGDAIQHGRTVGAPRPTFDALIKRSDGQVFGEETEGHEFPIS